MTLAAYAGHEALTFSDYLDLGTGKTLFAEPGGVYDISPAGGRVVTEVPEPWFTPVAPPPPAKGSKAKAAAETSGEPAHDEGPETGEPQ